MVGRTLPRRNAQEPIPVLEGRRAGRRLGPEIKGCRAHPVAETAEVPARIGRGIEPGGFDVHAAFEHLIDVQGLVGTQYLAQLAPVGLELGPRAVLRTSWCR
jgi:hypothetical protein